MNASTVLQIVALVIGGGGFAAVITAFYTRRKILADASKTDVDAAQVLSAASVALLIPMREQISILALQLTESKNQANELDANLRRAKRDLESAQHQVEELSSTVDTLTNQLQYYRDRYGPTTDELRLQREREARNSDRR